MHACRASSSSVKGNAGNGEYKHVNSRKIQNRILRTVNTLTGLASNASPSFIRPEVELLRDFFSFQSYVNVLIEEDVRGRVKDLISARHCNHVILVYCLLCGNRGANCQACNTSVSYRTCRNVSCFFVRHVAFAQNARQRK